MIVSVGAEIFDYHRVRGRQAIAVSGSLFEGEELAFNGTARVQDMTGFGKGSWSGDAHLLWHGNVGESLETSLHLERGGRYRVRFQFTVAPDYGIGMLRWNGNVLRESIDCYRSGVALAEVIDLGEMSLEAGEQRLAVELIGGNPKANFYGGDKYLLGLDYVHLDRLDNEDAEVVKEEVPSESETTVSFVDMQPVMKEYCFRCHGVEKTEGKLDLTRFLTREDFLDDIERTRQIVDALEFHEMPPEDETQLPIQKHSRLTAMFRGFIDDYLQEESSLPPVVMRRLNRYEYNNAVRDLLELKGDVFPLPEKPLRAARSYFDPGSGRLPNIVRVSNRALGKNQIEQHILTGVMPFAIDLQAEHGFNNRGEELSVSPILLESFVGLARSIVNAPEFAGYSNAYERLFEMPDGEVVSNERQLVKTRLEILLERAFRAPVSSETLNRYVGFFVSERQRNESFELAMKATVAAVLSSPRFLYLADRAPAAESEQALTSYELAARLAMFLWSSLPDEELLEVARNSTLGQDEVLDTQIRRMLEDSRSQSLSQNFARQWLRLDQLITAVPDFERYEKYYARIGCEQWKFGLQTMLEPLLLFESILVEDRSIMLLIDSNYAYRTDEMASWYRDEIPFQGKENRNRFNTASQSFSRRALTTRREGGVITSAATLTMTSSPLRTNPINRGAWVATVVLNRPPPPPPDVVPEIEADDAAIEAKGMTLRERLVQHQVNPSCVSCHQKIDPLGFALENYDAVGRWRETYRSGLEIDASGELFGKASFKDVVGLKDALLENPEWFMRGFSEHLLAYALGRELEIQDKPAIDRIVRAVLADHGQFSAVVSEVVRSYPFLHKSNQTAHTE
ncbi:MAG: DUF1588 domain-containing protein [Verrucomicrobiaceae bacterium]|nr:DUF1588 domain-containing protein [Verrucomicrobiaceae bacterium]